MQPGGVEALRRVKYNWRTIVLDTPLVPKEKRNLLVNYNKRIEIVAFKKRESSQLNFFGNRRIAGYATYDKTKKADRN